MKHLSLTAHANKEQKTINIHAQNDTLCFISQLPTEMMEDIFIRCARDCYHSERLREYRNRPASLPPNWVNVSYVCRHWRDVALNCPSLWTYHFVASLR